MEGEANPSISLQANQKAQERATLRQYLPLDLQLTFAPNARKWYSGGELLRRRSSQDEDNRLFFQAVESHRKKQPLTAELNQQINLDRDRVAGELGIALTLQTIKATLEESDSPAAVRMKIATGNLDSAKKDFQAQVEKKWLKPADKVVQEMEQADPEFAQPLIDKIKEQAMEGHIYQLNTRGETFDKTEEAAQYLVRSDSEAARLRLQKTRDWLGDWERDNNGLTVGKALAPVDPEFVKKIIKQIDPNGRSFKAAELIGAIAPVDPVFARTEMEKRMKKKEIHQVVDIALGLAPVDPGAARRAMNLILEDNFYAYVPKAGKIALALGDYQIAEKCMWNEFQHISYYSENITEGGEYYGEYFAKKLAKVKSEATKQAMLRFYELRHYEAAGRIALELGDYKFVGKCIKELKEYGEYQDRKHQTEGSGWGGGKSYAAAGRLAFALLPDHPGESYKTMKSILAASEEWFEGRDEMEIALIPQDSSFANKTITRYATKIKKGGNIIPGVNIVTALLAANSLDPQVALVLLNRTFRKNDNIDYAIDIAVQLAKRPLLPQTTRLADALLKQDDTGYSLTVVTTLLHDKQDLGWFAYNYLPTYKAFQDLAIKINSQMEESKRWNNPKEFFTDKYLTIAKLHLLNLQVGQGLLNNLLSRGLSFAKETLEAYEPALNNAKIYEALKHLVSNPLANFSGMEFGQLLETAAGYVSFKQDQFVDSFVDIISQPYASWKEMANSLNIRMLELLAQSVGVEANIQSQDIDNWSLTYLPDLVASKQQLASKGDNDNLRLFSGVIKACLENRFSSFITSVEQEDELGQDIAKHNQDVRQAFEKVGINWENWLNFYEAVEMTVGTVSKVNREALFAQLEQRLQDWDTVMTQYHPSLSTSLKKDFARLNQQKKTLDLEKVDVSNPDWLKELFPTYASSLAYMARKDASFKVNEAVTESLTHLQETITILSRQAQEEKTKIKSFVVKRWDRDPRKDLFQGNTTHCCIAQGTSSHHPETLFQYLIDQGVQVAEIVDPSTGKPIAQTWLFVSLDKNGRPMLVADNFEVNARYPAGQNINQGIRESMFQFLQKYAEVANIPTVILGSTSTNDVDTSNLSKINIPKIDKLGGYFNDDEYYLEAADDTSAYLIYKGTGPEPEKEAEKLVVQPQRRLESRFHALISRLRGRF